MTSAVLVSVAGIAFALAVERRRRDGLRVHLGAPGRTAGSSVRSLVRRDPRSLSRRAIVPSLAVAGLAAGSLFGGVPLAVGGAIGAPAALIVRDRRRRARRQARADDQLADAVASIAAGMRAGLSLSQAVRAAADEGEPPLADELRRVAERDALGIRFEEALSSWAVGRGGRDVRLTGSVLALHRRTGGDLPRVLDDLARTLRSRRAASREIRSYTAQARLSAAILGLLPVGFFLFLSVTSPSDVEAAYRSGAGLTAILVGFALQGAAFLWIRRLLRVEL